MFIWELLNLFHHNDSKSEAAQDRNEFVR